MKIAADIRSKIKLMEYEPLCILEGSGESKH